ncbi:MAG: hypothetical protein AB7K24_25690 [Gemmataceae bacterium]
MDEAAPLDPPDVTAIELKLSLGDGPHAASLDANRTKFSKAAS